MLLRIELKNFGYFKRKCVLRELIDQCNRKWHIDEKLIVSRESISENAWKQTYGFEYLRAVQYFYLLFTRLSFFLHFFFLFFNDFFFQSFKAITAYLIAGFSLHHNYHKNDIHSRPLAYLKDIPNKCFRFFGAFSNFKTITICTNWSKVKKSVMYAFNLKLQNKCLIVL